MGDSSNYHFGPPTLNEQQETGHYNLSMLYCGFFVVATAGLILAVYHCLALNWCADYPSITWPPRNNNQAQRSHAHHHHKFNAKKLVELDSTLFKYKGQGCGGGGGSGGGGGEESECAVCLSVFEQGEDVRELVRCKHSFHASCIDIWLFSHFDCPLCRAPVGVVPGCARPAGSENLGAGLSDSTVLPV